MISPMNGVTDFLARRKARLPATPLPRPAANKTVLISSYIWWTELMAYALLLLGC